VKLLRSTMKSVPGISDSGFKKTPIKLYTGIIHIFQVFIDFCDFEW